MAGSVRSSAVVGAVLSCCLLLFTAVMWSRKPSTAAGDQHAENGLSEGLFDETIPNEPNKKKGSFMQTQRHEHRSTKKSSRTVGSVPLVSTRSILGVSTARPTTRAPATTARPTIPPTTAHRTTVSPTTKPPGQLKQKENMVLDGYGASPSVFHPDHLELYTRLNYAQRSGELRSMLLPSMQLFWPHAYLVIALDAESDGEAAKTIAAKVAEEFPPLHARSALIADYGVLKGVTGYGGWQRGQLDMMFADTVVRAKYVGLLDTDTFFSTLVAPQAVFTDDSRPIIFATIGRIEDLWSQGILNAQFMLKKDYVIGCMNHFPVVFKTAHIKEMRAYVEKVHGKPFLEVYKQMMGRYYCHYSIMCNYVWHFHQKEYSFHYWNYFKDREGWDRPLPGQTRDFSFVTHENKMPIASISTHLAHTNILDDFDPPYGAMLETAYGRVVGHINGMNRVKNFDHLLVQGFCYVAIAQCRTTAECSSMKAACTRVGINEVKYQYLLFRFEMQQTWEWDTRTKEAQRIYYKSLKSYMNWIDYGKATLAKYCPTEYSRLGL